MTSAGSGSQYEALIQLLKTSEAIWEASRIFFSRWDISPSQFNILNLLRDFPEGCTQTQLSRKLITHRSNITGMVDRMEARGLLRRQADPSDRRVFHVVMTPKAEKLLEEVLPQYYESAEKLWKGISDEQSQLILESLNKLASNLQDGEFIPAGEKPNAI